MIINAYCFLSSVSGQTHHHMTVRSWNTRLDGGMRGAEFEQIIYLFIYLFILYYLFIYLFDHT